jgi:NTE family protein
LTFIVEVIADAKQMKFDRSVGQKEDRLAFVAKVPLERLTRHARPFHVLKGARFCEGQQLSDAAYYILSGSCELRSGVPDQAEEVLHTLGPGDVFGALDASSREASTLGAVAVEDSVVLRIDRDKLKLLREPEEPTFARNGANGPSDSADAILPLGAEQPRQPQKVVTMGFISPGLSASLISEQLASLLAGETGDSVVLLQVDPKNGEQAAPVLPSERARGASAPMAEDGFHRLNIPSHPDSADHLAELIDSLRGQFRYVLIQSMANAQASAWLSDWMARSDLSYLFLEPGKEAVDQLEQVVDQMRKRGPIEGARLKPIVCLADGEGIDSFDLLAQRASIPMHLFVHGCPWAMDGNALAANLPARFKADLRRIAREISGRLLGLALSSGAAKGFAHVGVLQVLEENGIEVDIVAGASMGAYVGALWAYGLNGTELERLAREMEGRWALWSLVDPVFPPRQGFLRGFAVKKRLMRSIGGVRFGDLVRPLRVVAGNLATLDRIVFSSGEVATAVHASSAVPGICVPVTINGDTCIDGGVVDPLPVEVLREMGVTRIIAVDVIPTPERIRLGLEAEHELAGQKAELKRKRLRKVLPLDQKINYFARGNLLEILMRSVQGAQIRVAEAACRLADLVLRPDICDDRWLDYANPGKFIARGREVALKHLEEIKQLAGKTVKYEREPAQETMASLA